MYRIYDLNISIHAPAKGATAGNTLGTGATNISIHAPAKGATTAFLTAFLAAAYFNPRTREGCDFKSSKI